MQAADQLLTDNTRHSLSRRAFAKLAGAAGAGWLTLGRGGNARAQELTDVDILNFALNLEYSDAEFYTVITTGRTLAQNGIPVTGVGTLGPTTGVSAMSLSGQLRWIAEQLAYDEQQHVLLLRSMLGSQAIAKPALDYGIAGPDSIPKFLNVGRVLEDVGASAYAASTPLIQDRSILATAARIALTEAYHASTLRLLLAQSGEPAIGPIDPKDVVTRLFQVDDQGRTMARTPSEVLAAAYLNRTPGTSAGGLFPNGVNGPIRSV